MIIIYNISIKNKPNNNAHNNNSTKPLNVAIEIVHNCLVQFINVYTIGELQLTSQGYIQQITSLTYNQMFKLPFT